MSTVFNANRERSLPLSYRIYSLVAVFLITLMVTGTFFALAHVSKQKDTPSSFGFSVTGDYDQTTDTTNNLQEITKLSNGGQIGFHLGLGDFSYVNNPTNADADNWSNYAKGKLPTNFPFEIVAGRHDVSAMSEYEKDLPDHIGDVTVNCTPECVYGQQYYFDYPSPSAPLARFVIISPNQTIPGYTYNYTKGGADYTWVKNTIDAAHTAGIPWVIVGMHEYCFAIGYVSCKNQDLLDLLLNENVDVILQAQKHNYQRSKQLALTPSSCKTNCCPTLNATSYNANCVANATNSLTQGKGSVIVLTGTGGASLLSIPNPPTDPKAGYYKNWESSIWGISRFTISSTQLTEQFDAVTGGTFNDSFTITASTSTPTPSPSPTPSVTPSPTASPSMTPSATPGTTIAQDDFTRNDQPLWGKASDTQLWGADANKLSNFSITANMGQVTGSGSNMTSYNATLGPSAADAEVVTSGSLSSFGTNTLGAVLRWTDANDFYKAYITGSSLIISKKVGGTVTKLKSVSFTATAGTSYTIDFSVIGSTLLASAWPTADPTKSVTATTTDSSITAPGFCGVLVYLANGVNANFSSFLAKSH